MTFLRYAIGANYKRFFGKLRIAAKKAGRSTLSLALDFLGCFLSRGFGLSDYLNYELWTKTRAERKEYVSIKDMDAFYARVSPAKYKTFFTVKFNFLENFAKYITRAYIVPTAENFAEFEAFCAKNPQFMLKPYDGLGGAGVRRVDVAAEGGAAALHAYMVENRLFAEELIVQHEEMAALCPSSVNTVRVMTSNVGGNARILYVGLRVGAGADVDNFHAGGMGVHVDPETGVLVGNAKNKDLEEFETHPVTGVRFDGRKLPYWDEIRAMCLEASHVNTNIHVVGWDVAITPNGPTFVEGNRRPGFDLPQVSSNRGRMDIMRSVYAEMDAAEKE